MAWTINNQSPADLGVTFSGWTENALNPDVMTLAVAKSHDVDLPAGLEYNDPVTLRNGSEIMFQGRVTVTPRMMDPGSESIGYTISGPGWDLDNLIFQEAKGYYVSTDEVSGEPVTEQRLVGYVVLGRAGETTGTRISTVVDFAISQGANLQKGSIAPGIAWWPNEHKDQTCGQVIRDYMRLTPDLVEWIDYTTTPPTYNVTAQADLPEVVIDVNAAPPLVTHEISKLDAEKPRGVVIRFERPETVNGQTKVRVVEQTAGATSGFSVLHFTAPLAGLNLTTEKAVVSARDIPEDGAVDDDAKQWWIDHVDELRHVSEIVTPAALKSVLKIAAANIKSLDIRRHTRVLPPVPDPPAPVNPAADPIDQTDNVADYPRELVSGDLPQWLRFRHRPMEVSATLAMKKSDIDGITDKDVKKRLRAFFEEEAELDGTLYQIATYQTTITATNAQDKEYEHFSSYEAPEEVPPGLAAAVFAQYSRTRHTGSVKLTSRVVDKTLAVGKAVSFSNGRAEWVGMKEIIQSVSYDVNAGTATAEFGPPDQLGADDMIERIRAQKRLPMSYGFEPGDNPPASGGTMATPIKKTVRVIPQERPQTGPLGPRKIQRKSDGTAVITPVVTLFHEINFKAVTQHTPKIGADAVNADPSPKFTLAPGSHKIYADFATSNMGIIAGDVTYVSTTGAIPTSTNHVPPSAGGSGTTGSYKKHICTYVVDADASKPVEYHQVASAEWKDGTRRTSNNGGGAEIHIETTSDGEDKLRTIVAGAGVTVTQSGDTIEISCDCGSGSEMPGP